MCLRKYLNTVKKIKIKINKILINIGVGMSERKTTNILYKDNIIK